MLNGRGREIVRKRLRKLPEYVRIACMINVQKKVGRPKEVDLEKRLCCSCLQRLCKSNRDVEELLELFEPLFGFKVSYKSIESFIQMKK